jgi:VCBS repeat-containing protein
MREKNPAGLSRQTKSRPEQVGVNCFLILPGAPLASPPFRTIMIAVSSFPQRLLRTAFLGFLFSTVFRSAEAAPTAVNDSYSTAEDTPLAVAGIMVVGTGFEPEPFGQQWSYLNNLPNTAGTAYPTDSASVSWKAPAFNTATSTVGPWRQAPLPIIAPVLDYFATNPSLPVSAVLSGGTAVTTYLFRNEWVLSSEMAANTQWTARYLIDDGAIVYINGIEAFRINMSDGQYTPAGAVTPLTATNVGGVETAYNSMSVDLTGKLHAGVNVIAVELHQITGGVNTDAGLDLTLSPVTSSGFTYVANGLGTPASTFNSGTTDTNTGFNNTGALHVHAGDRMPTSATAMAISGAWTRSITVPSSGTYLVNFKYRGTVSPNYDNGEFIEGVFRVDSTRFGSVAASGSLSGSGISLYRIVGNGNSLSNGEQVDTGWQTFSQAIPLTAGAHTILFGLYNSTSSGSTSFPEFSDIYLDDLSVSLQSGVGVAGVLLNDTGSATRTAVKDTDPAHGSVVMNANGSFNYTPALNFNGQDSFTYHAVDETGSSTPATVTITVIPQPDPPVGQDDTYSVAEDAVLNVNVANGVLANDSDPDGDALTAAVRDTTSNGTLVLNANGSFTYTPDRNFNGDDFFTYRISDGVNVSGDRTATITVTPVNDPPTIVADSYVTLVNKPLNVTLTSSAGQPTTTQILIPAGSTIPLGDPTESDLPLWRYLDNGSNQGTAWRAPGFDDSTWSTGRAELGYGDSADGRPERTVVGYGSDAGAKYATTYFRTVFNIAGKSSLASMGLRLMRDDAAAIYLNGTEIYRDSSANGFPNLPANPAFDAYSDATISGADEALLVDLSQYLSSTALTSVVEGANTLAVEVHQGAGSSTDISMDLELSAQRVPYAGVLANDTDPDSPTLTAQLLIGTAHGTLVLNPNGTFLYTPITNYVGQDSFVYRVSDGTVSSAGVTVNLTVSSAGNVPPVAVDDSFQANEDATLTINAPGVLSNDTDLENGALTAQKLSDPAHGTLTFNSNGSFTYTPVANYNGPDSFTYRTRDPLLASSPPATVSLTVNPVNDPPVGLPETYGTNPGQMLSVTAAQGVLANDTDIDGQPLSAVLVAAPSSGTLNLFANGAFDYTPPAGFSGVRTFTYRASDGGLTSAVVTVTINVTGAPVANADSYTAAEDTLLTVNAAGGVLHNDTDPEGDTLTVQVVSPPVHGALTLSADGSFSYSPNNDYSGLDSFTYVAFDGARLSAPATVTLTISPVNDAPVAANDSYRTPPDQTLVVDAANGLLKNDKDAENSPLAITLISNPVHGALTLNADGSFTYVPESGFTGTDSFLYRVGDGVLFSTQATVEISVAQTSKDIVINEIMFRPGGGYPEITNREFIELYNRGTSAIDLSGWRIDSGVSFTFPQGRTMNAGSYLVVAANVAAFQAAYPSVTNVIGGWTGTLSNSGETLSLIDADGESLDSVHYAAEGDWAQRVRETGFNGWDWSSLANGGGRSLELRNPHLSNASGQNWTFSTVIGGTPGVANGALTNNIAPVISGVKHSPAVPTSTDRVLITCDLEDETPVSGLQAALFWRDASTATPGTFNSLPMSSDGKGGWFAPLDAKPNLSIVEFYISATDGTNTRTWPAPTSEGQNANCQYQVDDAPASTTAEMYRLVLTFAENQAYNNVAPGSDRQFNSTVIVTRGLESSIRYSSSMRTRGNSSRSYQFKPLRISIPQDNDLDGSSRFNLNPKAPFLQHLGMRLFQASGLRAPDTIPIDLRRNGVKYTTSTGSTPDFGYWVRMEDIGSEFVGKHWPLTGTGGAYKKGRNDWYWRATQTPPTDPNGVLDGFTKQNNSAANDWTDLTGLFTVWQAAASPHFPGSAANDVAGSNGGSLDNPGNWNGTGFTQAEMDSIATVADLDQWARWFAVMTIIQDYETNISNGQDDDYGVYFEPKLIGGTPRRRLQFIPHDLDTIFGLGDTGSSFDSRGLFDMTDDSYVFPPLLPLFGNNSTPGNAGFRTKYFNALRELLGTVFNADTTANPYPPFYAFVDQELGNWAPATTRTAIKDFVRQRRGYLLGLIGAGASTPAPGTSVATVDLTHGPLFINEILANNVSAHANGALFPDIVELRNNSGAAIDLSGKSLTDDPLAKAKFVFAPGTSLAAGAYMVLYADAEVATPGVHLGFGLNADGDQVLLYDSPANGQTVLDSITFGLQAPNLSIGRTGGLLNTWALCTPTIGAANTAVATLAAPSGLRINEWLGNADYRASSDFIELDNSAAQPVALGGMSLTDDFINFPSRGTLPQLSFMGPGAFVAFEAKGSSATPGNARELPFGIDATVGSVALLGANGTIVDRGDTLTQFRDVSMGRLPDGTGNVAALNPPSPGFSNAALPEAAAEVLNYLRITELMYNPRTTGQSEYIEFRNTSNLSGSPMTLDLSGVSFKNGITFTFPAGTSLAPGAYFVIVGEQAKFEAQFPGVTVGGVFTGKLDNAGESIRMDLAGFNIAILDFKYSDAWYPSTDGGGDALQIVDATASPAQWDKKAGWQAAVPSPGSGPPFSVYAGPDLSGVSGRPVFLDGAVYNGSYASSELTVAWISDSGPAPVTFTTSNYQDANAIFSTPGVYVLRLTATGPEAVAASDTVTVVINESYTEWAARMLAGQSAANRLPTADPDGDGVSNLAEYALNGNPLSAASTGLPQAAMINGSLTLTWQRNKAADAAVQIIPQITDNLQSWQEGPSVLATVQTGSTTGTETWRSTDLSPPGSKPKAVMRLKIIMP